MGRVTFTKTDPSGSGSLTLEALGLRWLADAGGAAVVPVEESSATQLALATLTPSRASATQAADFGERLAETHAAGAPAWGAAPPGWDRREGWIGTQTMPLETADTWGVMYAEQRMLPFLERAHTQFDPSERTVFDKVMIRLRAGDFDDQPTPARIHGDLWSGNAYATPDGITLIDPAAHGGHPVTDLAMLALFGYPHLERVLDAHASAYGLPTGFRDLIDLHQLHPLLVHTVTHSPSYGREALQIARRYA